jgi:hypothetical protein
MTEKVAFSVREFTQKFGIGLTRTYEEIASGRLLAKKVGCRTLILAKDADAWAANLPSRVPQRAT